jgi:hypothetical protein
MKGIFFKKPLEYSVEIQGEIFNQGDLLKGNISLKNHGANLQQIPQINLSIKMGDTKKIKVKHEKSFVQIVDLINIENVNIKANETYQQDFEINLENSMKISESNQTPFITVYDLLEGNDNSKEDWPIGIIQLDIKPHDTLIKIVEMIQRFHRFQLKTIKNKGSVINFKLMPPKSQEMNHLIQLDLEGSIDSKQNLIMKFNFKTNKINMQASSLAFIKESSKSELSSESKDYLLNPTSINQDYILKKLESIFDELKNKKKLF